MRAPGFYPDIPETEYHADDTALSASAAKVLLGKRPPTSTAALEFGTLAHVALLEPARLAEYVALDAEKIGVKADGTPAQNPTMTAAWKRAVVEAQGDGLIVVAQADYDRALAMADAVRNHPAAARILGLCDQREVSLYADHPTGARVRGRLDLLGPGLIADYKTAVSADPAAFGKTAYDFGYHISAANYLDLADACGLDVAGFAFIVAEKEPTPGGEHRVSVVQLSARAIDKGREDMAEACRRWLALGRRVDLPAYGDGWHTVDLPPWAYRDITDDYEELLTA